MATSLDLDKVLAGPRTVFTLFGFSITESLVNTWIVSAVLIILALMLRRHLELRPGKVQNVAELLVEGFSGIVKSTMGEKNLSFMPYIATLFMLILFSNLMGIFGFRSPTADINVTLGYALVTFFAIHFYGLKAKGWKYLKGMAEPVFIILPINIIGELARPVSLSMRLFGNMLAGSVVMALISGAAALFVPAVASIYFDLFSGILQSFIFVMLTMVFIFLAKE
ncbi:MAG: F0F1 ATP synthase subunit A [Eubacteriales bacterium]|nr:F0F1 ATP synthase subunit A [Eubacteriales bacterium]MDD3072935.1 F0F1 ATP synthase subunit A [Eubacteriales bacterium]MDD4078156.1 F0F1 ATP synthase subunit A [Eubacteriales bacterium]MDD4768443.1 F0F1 ATP synthase subunit A [Eubacteriales bacterium]